MRRHPNCLLIVLFGVAGFFAASEKVSAQRLCSDFGMGNGGYAAGYSMTVGRWASRGWSLGGGWGGGWGYGCGYRPWGCRPFGGWRGCGWVGGCGPRVCGGPGYWFGGPGFGFGGWAGSSSFFGGQSVYLATPQGVGATFFSGAVVPYVVPYPVPYAVPYPVPYPVPWFGARSGPRHDMPVMASSSRVAPHVAATGPVVRRQASPPRIASLRSRRRARDFVAKGDRMLREAAGDPATLAAVAETYRRATAAAGDDPDIQIRHAIALAAVGRHQDARAAVSKATALDGRLADRPAGQPTAVVTRGNAILRAIAAVGDGPLPGHLADVAAAWTGERAGPIARLAAVAP
jgi:hypothetical protein